MRGFLLFLVLFFSATASAQQVPALPFNPTAGGAPPLGLTLLDGRFLKLDASNDPLTGGLDLNAGALANLSLRFQFCSTCGAYYSGSPTNRIIWAINGAQMLTFRSGALLAENGTASAPSISNVNNEGTGLGWNVLGIGGADTLDFMRGGVQYLSLGNGSLIPSITDDVFDLGLGSRAFHSFFIDTSIEASSDGKALQVIDPNGVGVGVGGATMIIGQTVSSDVGVEQQQNNSAGGEPNYFRFPGYNAAGASTKPTCTSSTHEGRFWVSRNAGTSATFLCWCKSNAAGAFAVQGLNLDTGVVGACP